MTEKESSFAIQKVLNAAFREISSDFAYKQLTSGHINQTFWVKNNDEQLILQKLNSSVFKNLESINQNILVIGEHLKTSGYSDEILELVPFNNEQFLFENEWRIFKNVENTQTYLKVQSAEQAFVAAQSLSFFHSHISDLNLDKIKDSIQGFLDFEKRFTEFEKAIEIADKARFNRAERFIRYLIENKEILTDWLNLIPELPKRIIHGDPKISNFLFDESDTNKVVALIDWDTLLSGPILYDFGDMARSFTNLREEDDSEKGNNFSLENYQALKNGLLFHLKDKLTQKELQNLDLGVKTVIYVQAMRFLTDYLNGDIYYSVEYPNQNLNRAVGQMNLLKDFRRSVE